MATRYVTTEYADVAPRAPVSYQIRPRAKTATVLSTATGVVFTLSRLLGSASQLALGNGTNANLKLDAASGAISVTLALGDGVSQKALVRENDGEVAVEYPVTITGAASVVVPAPSPMVSISAAQSKSEGNSGTTSFTYTVTRSASAGAVAVAWQFAPGATSADDFAGGTYPAGGTVALADGIATGTFTVGVNGDATVEADETFTVSITVPAGYIAGAATSATGTILNDDVAALPTVAISAALSKTEGNSGVTSFIYTVTRSASAGAVLVPWQFTAGTTSADDLTGGIYPLGGAVALADGVATGTFSVGVNGDTIVEADEIFTVLIAAPSGYAAGASVSATGTIVNDDTATLAANPASPSIAANAAPGTLISNITKVPAGATPTVSPNDGRFAIAGDATNGWKVVTGLSAISVGNVALTVAATGANSAAIALTITAAAAASLRAVSGNNSVPTATTNANTMMNARSFHYARETLSQITIGIPNFYVNASDEDVGIGPATVTASVEYPIGSGRQQFLFAGQATGTAADKSVAFPDLLTLATPIPAGSLYKIRWFYSNPNGIVYSNSAGPIMYVSPSGNDGVAFGTALTDLTMSGDVASAQGPGGTGAKLMGVFAPTTRRAFGLLVDSRCYGQGMNSDSSGDRGELAPSIGDAYGTLNWAIPGHKVGTFVTAYNAGTGVIRANLMKQYCTDIVDEGGINDLIISPTTTATVLVTRKIAMRNLFPGLNYYASTIGGGNAVNDTERLAYNSSILGGSLTGSTAIIDIAAVVMDAPPAATWKSGFVNSDNTHETTAGYAAIKSSNVVKTALGI